MNQQNKSEGTTPQAERPITDDQIKYMVNRFLAWRLPDNFNPDAGISFKATFNEHTAHPMKHEPTGTNLFDFTQAEEMIRYLVDGLARAVAPVETPEGKHIHVCNAQLPAAHKVCVCFECGESYPNKRVAVETRLTAEQFWPEWAKANKAEDGNDLLLVPFKEPRRAYILFAEAFRDKSDELKKPERYFLLRYETEAAISAGLREEIERLAQMHRLVGNDYQYVYGSRHQVQKELAELRVKLTAAEAEAAALKRDYAHLDFLFTDLEEHANDLKFEAAALRERERKGLTFRDAGEG